MKTNADLSRTELVARNFDLQERLREAEETLQAIRRGEVDALVVAGEEGDRVFTLKGADHAYRLLIEQMNEGAVTLSADGTILYCNARFGSIVLAPLDKIVGRPFAEFIAPDDRSIYEAAVTSGKRVQFEARLRSGDDGAAPVHLSSSRLEFDGVQINCLVVTDLADQKRDEAMRLETLRNSNAYNRSLLETSLDPLVTIGADGKIQDVNAATEAATGRARAELIGTDFADFFTQPAEARTGCERAFREGAVRDYPLEIRRRDGRIIPVLYNASVYRDAQGNVRGVFAAARDVTELKRAQEELARSHADLERRVAERTSELARNYEALQAEIVRRLDIEKKQARLVALLEATPDIVGFSDARDDHVVYLNQAARKLLGIGEQADVGNLHVDDLHPEWAMRLLRERAAPEAEQAGMWSGEAAFLARDGREIPVSMVVLAHKSPRGELELYSTISRDISDLKRTESDLRKAKNAAEAAARAKSEFLANMSHEIRTPMNGVIGLTELALETDLTPQQRGYLQAIQSSGRGLLKILNNILDYSKIEAGELELEQIDFSLRHSLDEMLVPFAERANEKGLELRCDVKSDVPDQLSGDPIRLRQVLGNLLDNALKFTERGEAELSVRVEKTSAQDVAEPPGPDGRVVLQFSVRDTGVGIPVEKQSAIFRPFSQADMSMTRRHGGTGLGLAIAAELVRGMQGEIGFESEPGAGSTFRFTARFQLARAILDEAPREPEKEAAPPRPLRILVAEDNPINQTLAVHLLKKDGHDVAVAKNGIEALAALAQDGFDVVLMDVQMPVMDGFEATAAIRAHEQESGKHLPIIAVTAYAMKGDRERCLAAGMDGYVSKPIKSSELRQALRQAIQPQHETAATS